MHGRHYRVELPEGEVLHCYPRGKKSALACGDRVALRRSAPDQGAIVSIADRTSLIYRSDQFREKIIAANVTQAVVVLAGKPAFSESLLVRCLVAIESQPVKPLIVLNKADLPETAQARQALALYEQLDYPLIAISANRDISPLLPKLSGETSVLVGQSGMGKSTIVNALVPGAGAAIGELSEALGSGRHTTTSASLYHLDAGSHIIDSPGMQSFGLHHLDRAQLVHAFREFRPHEGRCKFADCRHRVEPGCSILAAVKSGRIDARRWQAFSELAAELEGRPPAWA